MKTFAVLLCVGLAVQSCQGFLESLLGSSPDWNGFRAGFGVNPFSSTTFAWLPRTVKEATDNGWVADSSVTCAAGGMYKGNRYTKDGDKAAMLLFDRNGFIAGIQGGIPKTMSYPAPNMYKAFNEEKDSWVVTAYFVEPSTICSSGRSQDNFDQQGTGSMLAFQTGPTSDNLMRIPMEESNVLSQTRFVAGKCFYMMGMHYWYNLSADMKCTATFPAFLLYNKGKLNGFGWAFNPNYDSSKRWEHPDGNVFSAFMKAPPTCLVNQGHPVSTLHIYMTDKPALNFC